MSVRVAGVALLLSCLALLQATWADGLKSGPMEQVLDPFDVKAITGPEAGKTLCYF